MLPGPPTLYHSLLAVEDKTKLSTLRAGVTGAADIPVELIRRVHDELPFPTLATGYGLTEAGTVTLSRPGDSFEDIATTAGVAVRRRRGAHRRRRRGAGPRLHRDAGLPRRPGRDRRGDRSPTGWLHTGDLGTVDDGGRLRIVGRKKDMFIVGGFNAYPAEIEGFLLEHPAVAQAAVIGVPDERLGQVGQGLRRGQDGRERQVSAADEQVIAWSRDRMAGFKVPRYRRVPRRATVERHRQGDEGQIADNRR